MNQEEQTRLLYRQEQFPIFQNRMYDTEEEARACPKGDVQLVEDQRTGLVYNGAFRPELMAYDAHYQNEQALSPLFQAHLESVSSIIDRCMGRDSIVDVGCGEGFFLEMPLGQGFDVTRFDPTYEGNNPKILKHYFEPGVGIKANGLVLRHVLEHIRDPVSFLHQLKTANGGSGKIYIEVPSFDWICEHRAWFDIFYEHVNYFRLADFKRMFGEVIESGKVFGGQYLYVIAELSSLRIPVIDMNNRVNFPSDFTNNLTEQNSHLGRRIQRRHIRLTQRAYWATCRLSYRYQSGKAGQIPTRHRSISQIADAKHCRPAKRIDHLCHEFKLSRRN